MPNFENDDGTTSFDRDTARCSKSIGAELSAISTILEQSDKNIARIASIYQKQVKPDGVAILLDRLAIYGLLCLILWRVW
jgi:hypothetical protein